MSMLKTAAIVAVAGGLAVFGTRAAATAAPAQDDTVAKQTLTVTIIGATRAKPNETCTFVADISGGTPPYNVSWIGVSGDMTTQSTTSSWSSVGNKPIWVDVEDATFQYASDSHGINIASSNPSC